MLRIVEAGVAALRGRDHRGGLLILMGVTLAHLAEHAAQALQIWALGWPRPQANGVLGEPFPWLVKSEWLHYLYALAMLAGLWLLRQGFVGRSRAWWQAAMVIQVWHHVEHLLLLVQALTGAYLLGREVPTSVVQLAFPRVELHLFYNAVVLVPMVVALYLHRRPTGPERSAMACHCARPEAVVAH